MPNIAYRTPDNQTVLIVLNEGKEAQAFAIRHGQQWVSATLPAGAAATYVWAAPTAKQ